MVNDSAATRFPAWAIALTILFASACMTLAIAPHAYADTIKPDSAVLKIGNFKTSKGIDVSREVVSIDVSSPDTLFNLTVTDRFSRAKTNKNIQVVRTLMQVDRNGRASTIKTVKNSDTFSFRARGLKAGCKLVCKTTSNVTCDANGKKTSDSPVQYMFGLNATLDSPSPDGDPSWEIGEDGFNYTFKNTGFKFVDGTTIGLSALRVPVTYKRKNDGTTIVGIGCNADDADFYNAVKNRNVWSKYTDADITKKLKAIDDAWLKNKFGAWGEKGLDWSLFGYAEFNTNNPDADWSVTLCGKIGISATGHAQYFIFTGDLSASVGGDLIASLTRHPKTKTFTGTLSIGAYGNLELYIGIGCQYIASAGVYGAGGLHAGLDLLPSEDLGFNDVYVNGEVGVKAKAFGFTVATWRILNGKKDLYKRQRPSTLKAQAEAGAGEEPARADGEPAGAEGEPAASITEVDANAVYPEVPRDYLDKGFVWNGSAAKNANTREMPLAGQGALTAAGISSLVANDSNEESAKGDNGFLPLVANTYSETGVQAASSGKDAIMVFIADANQLGNDVDARKSANRGVLVYSRYNAEKNSWSFPQPVQLAGSHGDDGTADYYPSVCMAEDGTAYVAWLNAQSDITSDTKVGDVADKLDVNVARIKPDGTMTVKTVNPAGADDDIAPSAPRICLVDGRPCVAWYTNQVGEGATESQVVGMAGEHDAHFAWLDKGQDFGTGTWSTAGATAGTGAVTSFALGDFDSTPTCAWSLGAIPTEEEIGDADVYCLTFDGAKTHVATKAANVQFAQKGSQNVLTFFQGGSIKSVSSASDSAKPTTELSGDSDNAAPSVNYTISGNLANTAMVSYAVAGDGSTDIHAQVLKDGKWSEKAEATDQDQPITFFSPLYVNDENGEPSPMFVYSSDNNREYDQVGDGSAALYSIGGKMLKRVSVEDVVYDDSDCKPGDKLRVDAVVTNTGLIPVSGVDVGIIRSDSESDNFAEGSVSKTLLPGESATVPVTISLPNQKGFDSVDGVEYMAIALPADLQPCDYDRQNEDAIKFFNVGDATLCVDATHVLKNGNESIVATVKNEGIAAVSGKIIFEDAATGAELASAKIPTLRAHKTFKSTYSAPSKLFRNSGVETIIVRIEGANVQKSSIASQTSVTAWDSGKGGIIGETYIVSGNSYKITGAKTASFAKAKNAKKVTVPATVAINGKPYRVTAIGPKAFASAKKKLRTTVIGKYVTTIGANAFSGCTKLSSLTAGKMVKTFGANCFKNCKKLKSFNTGASATTIGTNAFFGCVNMKSFTVGKNVKSIGANAYKGAKQLKFLTVKSKKLTKKKVKNCLRGSNVKTIKVRVGNKKANKQFIKKYRMVFTRNNCGKNVVFA